MAAVFCLRRCKGEKTRTQSECRAREQCREKRRRGGGCLVFLTAGRLVTVGVGLLRSEYVCTVARVCAVCGKNAEKETNVEKGAE